MPMRNRSSERLHLSYRPHTMVADFYPDLLPHMTQDASQPLPFRDPLPVRDGRYGVHRRSKGAYRWSKLRLRGIVRVGVIVIAIIIKMGAIRNVELLEPLEISNGLSYFVPDLIVIADVCMRIQKQIFNAFVASTLTDKAIDVIQNPRN
jgi:hypothetical protein